MGFELPMALKAHRYIGADQFPGLARFAFTVGPILLAATGPWNTVCFFQPEARKIWPQVVSLVSLVCTQTRVSDDGGRRRWTVYTSRWSTP